MNPISTIEECLEALEEIRVFLQGSSGKSLMPIEFNPFTESYDYLEEFTDLRSLLNGNRWPYAVNPQHICSKNSEADKIDRANNILEELVNRSLTGLKFLDFGCGEGHVVAQALSQRPEIAMGYDVVNAFSPLWGDVHLTTDLSELSKFKFDVILLHDVLDHVGNNDPIEVLKLATSFLADNGTMVVRLHPWCSRHGAHLYHDKNKAFIHLVFSDEEMQKLGLSVDPMQKVVNPKKTYPGWIKRAGLQIIKEDTSVMRVEDFFWENELVRMRLNQTMLHKNSEDIAIHQMEQSFVDYILQRG